MLKYDRAHAPMASLKDYCAVIDIPLCHCYACSNCGLCKYNTLLYAAVPVILCSANMCPYEPGNPKSAQYSGVKPMASFERKIGVAHYRPHPKLLWMRLKTVIDISQSDTIVILNRPYFLLKSQGKNKLTTDFTGYIH